MKSIIIVMALIFSGAAISQEDSTLEYRIASLDAGKWVSKEDTSVARVKYLLSQAEVIYGLPKDQLADMAARAKDAAKEKQLSVSISELLDWSLIACDVKCTDKDFPENITSYVMVRVSSGQTHHQAVHSLVILQNAEKRLSKASGG